MNNPDTGSRISVTGLRRRLEGRLSVKLPFFRIGRLLPGIQ
jgi:hypothetical protein